MIVSTYIKMKAIRIDKFLADRLAISRRDARALVSGCKIQVNGFIVNDPAYKVIKDDSIKCGDKIIDYGKELEYYLFHKPKNCICAVEDRFNKTIFELLPINFCKLNIMPVGRLDIDTTGLIILTNDGQLLYKLISPKSGIYKSYIAIVENEISNIMLRKMQSGIDLGDFITKPAIVSKINANTYKISICEGKFHQVKRMFEAVGSKVILLHRVSFGPINLDIDCGKYRQLNEDEIQMLYDYCNMKRETNDRSLL